MRPLHLALIWHMHQPYYKDDPTGTYLLPWVRLRSSKDYLKMAVLMEAYPRLRQTFNLVPSLLTQIDDYASGSPKELFLDLSRKPAAELTPEERSFLLRWMREPARFLRVQASPRYVELAARSETEGFTVQDLRDLQVWYNLAWCDPAWGEHDTALSALKAKDRHFTEEDKQALFAAQLDAVRRVIPTYSELARRGQVELTFSPTYHPILPLLCGLETAREALPAIELPARGFRHPEDGARQLELGRAEFQRLTGIRPRGLWPPEMAVAEDMVRLVIEAGVDWFVGDEDILSRSLGTELVVNVETNDHQLFPGDVLLQCSDGLHNSVEASEMAALCSRGLELLGAAEKLVTLANERDGSDNISVQLIRVRDVERMGMYRGRPYKLY